MPGPNWAMTPGTTPRSALPHRCVTPPLEGESRKPYRWRRLMQQGSSHLFFQSGQGGAMQPKHRLWGRRRFLSGAAWLSTSPSLLAAAGLERTAASPPRTEDNVYSRLGVPTPISTPWGRSHALGGTIMPPEVVRAMEEAGQHFVPMADLHEKSGRAPRPADWRGGRHRHQRGRRRHHPGNRGLRHPGETRTGWPNCPTPPAMPNQVIIQKSHREAYEAQIKLVGTRVVGSRNHRPAGGRHQSRDRHALLYQHLQPQGPDRSANLGCHGKEAWGSHF